MNLPFTCRRPGVVSSMAAMAILGALIDPGALPHGGLVWGVIGLMTLCGTLALRRRMQPVAAAGR